MHSATIIRDHHQRHSSEGLGEALRARQPSRLSDGRVLDVGDLRRLGRTDASMDVVNSGRDRACEQAALLRAVEEPLALDHPGRDVGR